MVDDARAPAAAPSPPAGGDEGQERVRGEAAVCVSSAEDHVSLRAVL